MRRRRNSGFLFFFLFILFFGTGGMFPLLLILAVVLLGTFASIKASNKEESTRNTYNRHYTRSSSSDQQKISRINAFLKKWFQANHSIQVSADLELVQAGSSFVNLSSLEVYKDHSYLCSMQEFQNRFPDSYKIMINDLYDRANREMNRMSDDIVDVEVTPSKPKPKQTQAQPKKEELSTAQKYINQINSLNTNIPDDKISKDLYETCAYLKQIDDLSRKLPNTKDKLNKLYDQYLPILIKILTQYESLQVATTDPAYEETKKKLSDTIQLINTAMQNIISSMTDEDFINLSADISTLEAVLKKDGLTNDTQMLSK